MPIGFAVLADKSCRPLESLEDLATLWAEPEVRVWVDLEAPTEEDLRRLDEILVRRGVRPLPALEEVFDPHTMHAAELAKDPDRADGIVVGELRKGFLYNDDLLRSADVVVNRVEGRPAVGAADLTTPNENG